MRQTLLIVLLAVALPTVASAQVSNLHSGAISAVVEKASTIRRARPTRPTTPGARSPW